MKKSGARTTAVEDVGIEIEKYGSYKQGEVPKTGSGK